MDATRAAHLAALQLEQARYMKRLYEAVAAKECGKPWPALTEQERAKAVSVSDLMCLNWGRDAALRDSYAAGVSEIVDLVAQQYHVAEQIAAVAASGRRLPSIRGAYEHCDT